MHTPFTFRLPIVWSTFLMFACQSKYCLAVILETVSYQTLVIHQPFQRILLALFDIVLIFLLPMEKTNGPINLFWRRYHFLHEVDSWVIPGRSRGLTWFSTCITSNTVACGLRMNGRRARKHGNLKISLQVSENTHFTPVLSKLLN